ncbi:MAG TPA: hypothetical protein VHQ24_02895 [Lachnospiraceae bacterium]|nr:hypothetical protein [Lachnospiraceae bacterium]HEX3075798.1 hypothetical protein [Lachnospiraceae bacterium]
MSNFYNENHDTQGYYERNSERKNAYPEAANYYDWPKYCPKYPEPPKCWPEPPKYPCYEWPKYPCYEYPKYPCYECPKEHCEHKDHKDHKDRKEDRRCFVFRYNATTQTAVAAGVPFQFPIANTIPTVPCKIAIPSTTETALARGYYEVTFVASIANPGGAPVTGTVSLRLNGVAVAGGTFDYALAPTETDQVVINAIVPVTTLPGILTVATDTGSGTINVLRSSLTVERLSSFDRINYEVFDD